ncbi:MAG: UDP-N-acetylmuramate--L-alanine ligase [Rhodobiaceae bacterium]|jgi:UDP-N-acetylmuramate--alanine ligase|nr:UDP-N-acetylmuramate--L-alanine ligase [Rhodobiaceae bacterium]MBT5517700.1 UDP-N-acetylmuramate--L-alanine ligase [Rhodobiaceae bacterium]MBT7279767.1 UDP-N-acetylmuramate--L-alanine ligase [Rhodobiaceae bacterium]MDG2495262.1 UDP-N-acetylmuramate--L-alanine ligase [Alphaproteobacteria bacterium]
MTLPKGLRPFGRVHIVGIGGIGMSGIGEVMHLMGYEVQGSDMGTNANTARLAAMGIEIMQGHDAAHVEKAGVVTISSAVPDDNPEVQAARAAHIPVVRRAEMLAELMRLKPCITIAGTHGKTTTTSLTAALLDAAALDPTVMNGGIINAYGTNARLGQGEWMVVEADESDGTFVRLPTTIAIVTNIDPEHLEHYGDFDGLRAAFDRYIQNIPFYGVGIVCLDHPEVQSLVGRVTDRRLITYGLGEQADVRAIDIREEGLTQSFDVLWRDRRSDSQKHLRDLSLPMAGKHNLQNALAAIAAAIEVGGDEATIRKGLAGFGGVKRRFTPVTTLEGNIRWFDDYAHHPVEIEAVLESARAVTKGRVIGVMQPHRYTRLRDLFEGFCASMNGADTVLVTPVFEAGERPIDGFDSATLADGLRAHGHRHVVHVEDHAKLADVLAQEMQADDVVIFMGAGSISNLAYAAAEKLGGKL